MEKQISREHFARIIEGNRRIVALTGAGMSTAAGIPDFRSQDGAYNTVAEPEKLFDINWFRRKPEHFYTFAATLVSQVAAARPTAAHHFLARLEREGRLTGVVTQNIDMLHQAAGSQNVLELHGAFGSSRCFTCGQAETGLTAAAWQKRLAATPLPRCPCGGVIKPDIVFFGEQVAGFARAEQMVRNCDLLLVLGTSLNVAPASMLPYICEAPIVVVGKGEIATDYLSVLRIDDDLDAVLAEAC